MKLVPEEVLIAAEPTFDGMFTRLQDHYDLALLDDPLVGRPLKFYLLLTEFPELLGEAGQSAERVFASRYYWFLRFAKLRQALVGYDAGLEQQAFQILENADPTQTDFSIIEAIESAADQDVAAELGREK